MTPLLRLAFVAAILVTTAARAAEKYIVTDLGTLGGVSSSPTALNDAGHVVGVSAFQSYGYPHHAFLYSNGVMKDLGTLRREKDSSTAVAINNSGQILGRADRTGGYGPFLYEHGVMTPFGTPASFFTPKAISASGLIVGSGWTSATGTHAYYYANASAPPTRFTDSSDYYSDAVAVNDAGHILGQITVTTGTYPEYDSYTFVYANGTLNKLHLPFIPVAINNSDQIIGNSNDSAACLYADGVTTYLGSLGGNFVAARAINDSTQIVGWAGLPNGSAHGFLYSNGALSDLNDLVLTNGIVIYDAHDINNAGQIACVGMVRVGGKQIRHAVLLTPVSLAPKVAVSGRRQVRTARTQITLRGRAIGTSSYVTVRNGHGKRRKITHVANWTARVPLNAGVNRIKVVAHGNRGDSRSVIITAVRQ